MLDDLLVAVALMLVLEGMMPFLSPDQFRQTLMRIAQMKSETLRILGLVWMCAGVVLLYLVR